MARADTPAPIDEAPRRPLLWAVLISALATLTLAWPALLGRFLVNPHSDQFIAGYAFRHFAAESLREGNGFPLWNPYLSGGLPYVGGMHGDIFYPTFLLRLLLPTDIAMTWGFVLHMLLAGVFTYGFLRAAGVRFHAALIGGVAYLLAGPIASYASPGHDGKLFVSTLLPAALWLLIRGIRGGSLAAFGGLAIVTGLAVLSPHPQLLQYMLLVMGAYALWLVFVPDHHASAVDTASRREPAPAVTTANADRGTRIRGLLLSGVALIVGGAMGAIQYLPLREYTAWSPRAGGKGWEHAVSYSFPLEETINTYLPQFSGILDAYWGRNGIHFHSEYLGAAVLVIALLGIGGGMGNRHRRHGWFWLGALVVSLLWAWGGNTPFYHIVYNLVPGTKYFRAPSTILYVVSFSVAVLAAFGAERVLARRVSMRYVVAWTVFAVIVGVLATAGGFTNIAMSIQPQAGDWILQNASAVTIGAWRSALFVLLVCGVIFLLLRDKLDVRAAGWALVAIVALDLWSVSRHYWMFSERADTLFASDAIVEYVKSRPQPARVLPLRLGDSNPRDPFIRGDAFMTHDIRNTLGYHGNELQRYLDLMGEQGRNIGNPNFWTLTNTQYLYTDVAQAPIEGAQLVAGPLRNAFGTMVYLYELPGNHPPAWIAPMIVKLDDQSSLATVLDPRFDVQRVAIFDTSASVAAKPIESTMPERSAITPVVTRHDPGALDVRLDAPAPEGSALVLSENYFPGWTATVDGKPATVGRANYVLMGVELPAGAREIQLRFDSPAYHTGKVITLIAVLAGLLAIVLGFVADRRRTGQGQRLSSEGSA